MDSVVQSEGPVLRTIESKDKTMNSIGIRDRYVAAGTGRKSARIVAKEENRVRYYRLRQLFIRQ